MATFIKDVEEIRQRAMRKIEDGPVTDGYHVDKDRAIQVLNEALATEIVCVLRYMHHYFMATGVNGRAVAAEFKEHADSEREHADEIAERIQQLGGKPDLNPGTLLQRSVAQYVEGETLADMIREDLIAERIVIDVYHEMIRFFGDGDPTTRRMLEHILEEEEEHAAELSDLLYIINPHTGEAKGRDPVTDALAIETTDSKRVDSVEDVSGRPAQYTGILPNHGHEPGMDSEGRTITESVGDTHLTGGESGPTWKGTRRPVNEPPAHVKGKGGGAQKVREESAQRGARAIDIPASPKQGGGVTQRKRGADMNRDEVKSTADSRREPKAQDTAHTKKRREPEPFAGRGTVKAQPSNIPGVSGRTMDRRHDREEIEDEVAGSPNRGGMSGTNRTPKILQKNRKSKRAA